MRSSAVEAGGPLLSCGVYKYRGADKSLTLPTSRCILFDGENISFDAILVIYINSNNIPPIMIINRIYEDRNLQSQWFFSFLVRLRTYQHPCRAHSSQYLHNPAVPTIISMRDIFRLQTISPTSTS